MDHDHWAVSGGQAGFSVDRGYLESVKEAGCLADLCHLGLPARMVGLLGDYGLLEPRV